ncbi:putative cell polarity protein [Aspergillus campestris IBT 28561]|uniref:Cell polarity protein n=1 Tax=Aspergillus campestris (strain IBT 28561) TaxID=1392248 RepID=A0A2I1D9K9_ASPC2|nr:putative cell polarity protein [Aspergillus campestris IBT 28561]PKY06560.1 putative cell polarity protein [Aspergillus campestris IBT 28561]
MAFLFKSKKNQQGAGVPPGARNINASDAPAANPPAAVPNAPKEREAGATQTPTPSSSYNNSLNSINSAGSPEYQRSRQRAESESQSQRQPQTGSASNSPNTSPGTSLYPWSQRRLNFSSPQANPFPRYGAAINAVSSKEGDIYMMGGLIDGSTVKGDLWMMESSGGNLSCFPIATVADGPGPRVGHASLLVGNAFIVFGGDTKVDENDALDDTLYLLNTSSRQWSRSIPPSPRPSGRYGHTLNILGSKIYVFGGQVEGFFFNDLVAFDLNQLQNPTNTWEFLIRNSHEGGPPPGQIPPARTNHTIVGFNDKLYLFGGTNGVQWFNDVWCYDPRANQWTQLDCVGFIPTPREGHAAALVNDVMYIFGGRTDEGLDLGDLAAFRISTRRWYSFQNMGPAPSPRSGHSMTAFGKHIIVVAGEPSSAPRDPVELSMAYILDTSKIRYPAEAPAGERGAAVGPRKASSDRPGPQTGRTSREAQHADAYRRGPGAPRESMMSPTNRPAEYGPGAGPGSRLPRASIAQAPQGPRPPTPPKLDRGYGGPPVDTVRAVAADRGHESPGARDSPRDARAMSETGSAPGGNRTPTQQQSRMSAKAMETGEAAPLISQPARQRSLRQRQRSSMDSADESILGRHASIDGSVDSRNYRNSKTLGEEPRSPRLTAHQEALIKELEALKGRNAWYASELALAKKAGYSPNPSSSPALDERSAEIFADDDRPLIEAFLAMRAELAKMQATVDRQAAIASKRVAEVEHQRDVAVNEAAYSRAKLAAHGGSQRGTPQPDRNLHDGDESVTERATDVSRRLALALAAQNEAKARMEVVTTELDQEKRGRELAEETCEATRKRLAELEMNNNSLEAESLRAELHQVEASLREESMLRSEAESALKQLSLDKEEFEKKAEDASSRLKDLGLSLTSLREAVTASSEKSTLLERQLDEERERREGLERKLLQLRSEHEERTSELENASRRLRDAEELAETNAREAETHKNAFLSGLDRASSFDSESSARSFADQRVAVLEAQVERANQLAKSGQAAADDAAEKLRRAEERIAGLEAYQEQASREGLQLRRQLQAAMKDSQAHAAENREIKSQLENHQREAGALAIQHTVLKDLLGERGVNYSDSRRSPRLESPGSRFGTPEQGRLRELEQQLSSSLKAHDDLKSSVETREQEAERAYREKLEQLENDYQSAVHYVKGTEKMLKRMKDELSRYKSQNAKIQSELEAARQAPAGASSDESSEWEAERTRLQESMAELQQRTASTIDGLEQQVADLKKDLSAADTNKQQYESARQELVAAAEKARGELEQLQQENSLLETRASDAEHKVTMLLDQVEASVGHYRRQSHPGPGTNGISRSHSNASSNTISGNGGRSRADSATSHDPTFLDNRGSMALDSLANELETLRTHWESTNHNYRLSTQSDFDRTPTKETGMSDSLAEWRRRLDEGETRASSPGKSQPRNAEGQTATNMI